MREREPARPAPPRIPAAAQHPVPILALQRSAGNHAVARLLQRAPETEHATPPAAPPWFARTSPLDPLPGQRPRHTDRKGMADDLFKRRGENAASADAFVQNYTSALMRVWTGYVTDEMAEAAEDAGWSVFRKLAGFILRDVLVMVLFPEVEVEAVFEKLAAHVLEKSLDAELELMQGAVEEGTASTEVGRRARHLRAQTAKGTAAFTVALGAVVREITTDGYYQEWLDTAPDYDLHLFRLPPAIPQISDARFGVLVAQVIAEFLHEEAAHEDKPDESIIAVSVGGAAGRERVTDGPTFRGPDALGQELAHQYIGAIPKVALSVVLQDDPRDLMDLMRVVPAGEQAGERLRAVIDAYIEKSPARITRDSEGHVSVSDGGLIEQLHLYALAGGDAGRVLTELMHGVDDPVSPRRTAADAAGGLWVALSPSREAGARHLLADVVDPLAVRPPQKR